MKKVLSIMAATAFAIMLSSCSSNSPEGVVKKALDAALDGDGETYVELIFEYDESEWEGTDKKREREMARRARDIEKNSKRNDKADDDERIESFKIIDVTPDFEDEDRAEVEVKYFYADGHTQKMNYTVRRTTEGDWRILW
ncbi:MAG: DUF4878 domain-containing protein [Bacteroidaceae bacterium]|nr:DUF4878 domain-containing protein [Bacteroidaceae bacterium]